MSAKARPSPTLASGDFEIPMRVRDFDTFSALIKALRRERELSQRELARTLDLSAGYIGQWESGHSQPSEQMADRISATFDLDDPDYVRRLAYAPRAPEWMRASILAGEPEGARPPQTTPMERRILASIGLLSPTQQARLAERITGWVDAIIGE